MDVAYFRREGKRAEAVSERRVVAALLVDTGADRTVFSAGLLAIRHLRALAPQERLVVLEV